MGYVTSAAQVFCRQCGKRVRKVTHDIDFGRAASREDRKEQPATIEEARRRVNAKIVHTARDSNRLICRVSVWDGETYAGNFCTNNCAIRFANSVLRYDPSLGTKAYQDAVASSGQV